MKRQLIAILLCLATILSLSACGERVPPVVPTPDITPDDSGNNPGEDVVDPTPSDEPFVVTVMLGGVAYSPDMSLDDSEALKVRLTDGKSAHTAKVGADGKASIDGLDGDYTVTLLNVPEEYAYNPNIYTVNNDKKTVSIELLNITKTYGDGADLYSGIRLSKTGNYRAQIKKEGRIVYYQFSPTKAGRYCIESMMDISAEMYNPKAEIYTGSFASWYYNRTLDDGGVSGSYTKNFKHIIEIDEEFLGNSYLIGVLVEGKDATYPTYVDFSITYLGDYNYDGFVTSTLIAPEFIPGSNNAGERNDNEFLEWREELYAMLDANLEEFGSSNYRDAAIRIDGKRIFDQDYYKLNPDDNLYHLYDLEKFAATNGWGPILYADITVANMFMQGTDFPSAFNIVEYNGNKALTLCEGTVNYKLFIEGYDPLATTQSGQSGSYFCNSDCPCYQDFENNKPGNNGGVCTIEDNCQDCNEGCRHIPESMKYQKGYANIVNEDGRAPVTEELKLFLQRYSENQRLFSDGNGWVEIYSPRYDAYEDSQWLFACGYYSG